MALGLVSLAQAAQFNVTVGGGPLKYDPQFVVSLYSGLRYPLLIVPKTANPGDTVVFTFKQSNHTATQSTFAQPCVKASGGFDSGL